MSAATTSQTVPRRSRSPATHDGVVSDAYATGTLGLGKIQVVIVVTVAALVKAVLLPVAGRLAHRFGARVIYATGIAAFGLTTFPVFALFNTRNIVWFAVGMVGGVRRDSRLVL